MMFRCEKLGQRIRENSENITGCWSLFIRRGEGLNIWTKLEKVREVKGEEETRIDVEGGTEEGSWRLVLGPECWGEEVEEALIESARQGEEGRRRTQSFVLEDFWGGGGFTKNLETFEEKEVVDEILEGRETLKEVGGGGGFTTSVDIGEQVEGGGGSTS